MNPIPSIHLGLVDYGILILYFAFVLGIGFAPSSKTRNSEKRGVGFGPRTPTPGPITFRLRLGGIYPVLEDSDGVGFEPTVGFPLLLISSQVH